MYSKRKFQYEGEIKINCNDVVTNVMKVKTLRTHLIFQFRSQIPDVFFFFCLFFIQLSHFFDTSFLYQKEKKNSPDVLRKFDVYGGQSVQCSVVFDCYVCDGIKHGVCV